jgi:cobyrinic acid a,c-diamide synthase
MKGVLISGPASGAGKTTVAAALMAALRKRGLVVQPFKCGPDFIDPGHHSLICGRPSHNLDTWMLSAEVNQRIFASACRDADFAAVEGMMGLFDGVSGKSEKGSSAEIAKLFALPVLLVVDASSSARSVAALVHGFQTFDPDTRVVGVVLNRVAGAGHAEMLIEALRETDPNLVVGWFPHEGELHIKERYLGLQTAVERSWSGQTLDLMASLLEQHFPMDRLLNACEIKLPDYPSQKSGASADGQKRSASADGKIRIGVARDRAFCFYYEAGLEELRKQGAEIVEFSTLAEGGLPEHLDAIYFGGGYPELYAETLSNQRKLLADLRGFAQAGKPIYGECGGLIFLSRELIAKDGARWPMADLLPLSIQMTERLVHFGYADVQFVEDGIAAKGSCLRGHSFHCSRIIDEGKLAKTAMVHYSISREFEPEGFAVGSVFGSYVHLHFAAEPSFAERFVSLGRSARSRGGAGK